MDAEKYFDRILDKYADDDMMVASASAGKAACLEIRNDFTSAAKYYKTAAEKNPGEIWTSTYLLKAGQNFAKANDRASAQACFEEIEKKYNTSSEASIAKRSLAELKY